MLIDVIFFLFVFRRFLCHFCQILLADMMSAAEVGRRVYETLQVQVDKLDVWRIYCEFPRPPAGFPQGTHLQTFVSKSII